LSAGSAPLTVIQDIDLPVIGTVPVNLTVDTAFDFSLVQGDPSSLAPVPAAQEPAKVWYITGTLPGQDTCGGAAGTPLDFNNAPINVTAHGAVLTGSSGNPADTSKVYGQAVISGPGSFSIPVSGSVDAVTVFVFCDTDFSGAGSPGDIGGHYCSNMDPESPGIVYSPGAGNTVDISGFTLGILPVQISGDVIIDGSVLDTVSKNAGAKIVAQVYDSAGNLLDFSYHSLESLSFGVWVNGVTVGDTVTVSVFLDTNGNNAQDTNEPGGSVSHQVGSDAAGNDSLIIVI
jgi:hypothetical protein